MSPVTPDWNPRDDPDCRGCGRGEYRYVEQTTDPRGRPASLFKCSTCGHEVTA